VVAVRAVDCQIRLWPVADEGAQHSLPRSTLGVNSPTSPLRPARGSYANQLCLLMGLPRAGWGVLAVLPAWQIFADRGRQPRPSTTDAGTRSSVREMPWNLREVAGGRKS